MANLPTPEPIVTKLDGSKDTKETPNIVMTAVKTTSDATARGAAASGYVNRSGQQDTSPTTGAYS